MRTVLGWHFLGADMRLSHGDERKAKIGEWLSVEGEPRICEHGLHASKRAIDALEYLRWAPAIICRVELGSTIVHGYSTMVAQKRRILWAAHADNALRDFALDCATQALQGHYPDAPDALWHALDLRAAIAEGIEVGPAAVDAAEAAWAAYDAVVGAARAARSAARAARAADWAARAARAAARDATRSAVYYAACAAACAVTGACGGSDAQNRHLEELLSVLDWVSP